MIPDRTGWSGYQCWWLTEVWRDLCYPHEPYLLSCYCAPSKHRRGCFSPSTHSPAQGTGNKGLFTALLCYSCQHLCMSVLKAFQLLFPLRGGKDAGLGCWGNLCWTCFLPTAFVSCLLAWGSGSPGVDLGPVHIRASLNNVKAALSWCTCYGKITGSKLLLSATAV